MSNIPTPCDTVKVHPQVHRQSVQAIPRYTDSHSQSKELLVQGTTVAVSCLGHGQTAVGPLVQTAFTKNRLRDL